MLFLKIAFFNKIFQVQRATRKGAPRPKSTLRLEGSHDRTAVGGDDNINRLNIFFKK